MESENLTHAQRAVPCDVCENEVPGEFYCIQCKQTLCPQCEKFHGRVASSKDHTVVMRTQLDEIDTSTFTCGDHGDPASCHCEQCDITVCIKCITGTHKGHKMVDLNDILERKKKLLQENLNRTKADVLPKLKKNLDDIKYVKEKYEMRIQQIGKDMEEEYNGCLKGLKRIHDDRMKNLDTIQVANLAEFEEYSIEIQTKINSCEKRISTTEDDIRKNNVVSIAKSMMPPPEVDSLPTLPRPPSFVPGNRHAIDTILGKLIASPATFASKPFVLTTPTIVRGFKSALKRLSSICITKEGNVWLAADGCRKLIMVDILGQVLRMREIETRPISVDFMDCGDVIISPHSKESRSVSRLLRDGKEQHVYEALPSGSMGVSVTGDQKILICTVDGRVLKVNSDGTNVKEIYKGSDALSAYHAVENATGNIYICDSVIPAIVVISKDGNVLSTLKCTQEGRKLGKPVELMVDIMGNILCADFKNNCVYIIDQNHQVRELVGRSYDLQKPDSLAVDKDNNLWIAQEDGTVHVVKYLSP